MLYLNNSLLTSDKIIAYFEEHIDKLNKNPPADAKTPSNFTQFKNRLKAIFFPQYDKNVSDETVLQSLKNDNRFASNYPKLKQVFEIIFSVKDTEDKRVALKQLKAIQVIDWSRDKAQRQWELNNQSHGYFKNSPELFQFFCELTAVCRIILVLIEENNNAEDTLAYEYAYKLMALFIINASEKPSAKTFDLIAQEAYKLMLSNDSDKDHPFHNTLLVKLELPPAHSFQDKAGWQKLVRTLGVNAFASFAMAEKVEQKIAALTNETTLRAPKDLKEAKAIMSQCYYTRANEDSKFAELCYRYKVSEKRFNLCIDYINSKWPKKLADTLPDVQVKGREPFEKLFWVKMPPTDKRALILGDITDCCQSIGGNSEKCVKDSVSLSENSVYVLLKQIKNNQILITNGEINDSDYKIIGQSYIWKSVNGNICLDSIEYLADEITDGALKSMISDFAIKLLQENKDIKYVNLGMGGKTPKNIFPRAFLPEKMRQGFEYGDSQHQYCIAKTSYDNFTSEERSQLDRLLDAYPSYIESMLTQYSCYIEHTSAFIKQLEDPETFIAELQALCNKYPELETYSDKRVIDELLKNKKIITDMQAIPAEQRSKQKELMFINACSNHEDEKARLLLGWWRISLTENFVKKLPSYWAKRLLPSIEHILEKLEHVEDIRLLNSVNRKKLADLVFSSFIEELDSESQDIVDEAKLVLFIKNKIKEVSEQNNTPAAIQSSRFKIGFFELKESYDPYRDRSGPSIYEID